MARNLMAILRGVKPFEVVALGEALINAGIVQIEVPMNSPEPLAALKNWRTHSLKMPSLAQVLC